MRILYLMQFFVPPDGAWSTRSYEFAKQLISDGHDVLVITSIGMLPPKYRNIHKTTKIDIAGIPCVVIPIPHATGMPLWERAKGYIRYNLAALREVTRNPADVVYASSAPLTIAIPGIWAKMYHRIPMVFEVRDLWPEMPIAMGALRNPLLRVLGRALEWLAYHAANHVVALSPGMAQGIIARGISPDHVTVIPNFCDISLFGVPPSEGGRIRQQLNLTPGQPLIVYAGSFGLLNDLNYLVDLATYMRNTMPDARFLLLGNGVNKEAVTSYARSKGLLENTLWIWDAIPKCEMPTLLAAATIATSFFIPLKEMWKNSANKFFDALASGTPIAINYGDWQADLLRETGAGIVLPPDNPAAGAELLAEFLSDTERVKAAGEAARKLAQERFSRDAMAKKVESLLLTVVGEG